MKKLYLIFLVLFFSNCKKEEVNEAIIGSNCDLPCSQWERCTIIYDMFFDARKVCIPILEKFTNPNYGYWNGQLNIVDDLGNTFTQELLNLDPICADPVYYFNSDTYKYIMLPYPLSESAFYSNNGVYPDDELHWLDLEFTDPISFEFIINDSIYDPFVESIVFYQGTGQIKNTSDGLTPSLGLLEFNCEYIFEDNTFFVSFSATR